MGRVVNQPPHPKVKKDEELTDKDKKELDALQINYAGCPQTHEFNKVIQTCVEFWKSKEWKEKTKDKKTGTLYETRKSPNSGNTSIKFTSVVPKCSCGTLEALLLDDPEAKDDPKKSNIYKYDDILQQQFNLQKYAGNVFVNKTVYKSPIWGVAPRQMVVDLTYAALLNPKQQESLGVRPKSSTGLDDGLDVFLQCGTEYIGDHELSKADKGFERGHTFIYFIMGQEEKDGSLTFTLCIDVDPAGSIPKAFVDKPNSKQFEKAIVMHKLLADLAKDEKNERHIVNYYENDRLFSPMR